MYPHDRNSIITIQEFVTFEFMEDVKIEETVRLYNIPKDKVDLVEVEAKAFIDKVKEIMSQ